MKHEELYGEANRLRAEAKALNDKADTLFKQGREAERAYNASRLELGMTVHLWAIPMEWLFGGSNRVTQETALIIVKMGPKNAVVERADGGDFQFPRRTYKQVEERRTNLVPA